MLFSFLFFSVAVQRGRTFTVLERPEVSVSQTLSAFDLDSLIVWRHQIETENLTLSHQPSYSILILGIKERYFGVYLEPFFNICWGLGAGISAL